MLFRSCVAEDMRVSGLRELEALRRRQEELVRGALGEEEEEEEEDMLLLRNQLDFQRTQVRRVHQNCLRRTDTGLIHQIINLRLDPESEQLDSDSRPSSGFFEWSEQASLSNSSNSVFSSVGDTEGRLPWTGGRSSCLDCDAPVGGCGDGAVRRSLSAPPPPSPLHDGLLESDGAGDEESSSVPAPLVPQSSSWPVPSSSSGRSQKRLDSYISSLLQRRALPVRSSRPRTSISTEPSQSILRPGPGLETLKGSDPKPTSTAAARSERRWSVETDGEELETQNGVYGGNQSRSLMDSAGDGGFFTKTDMRTRKSKGRPPLSHVKELGAPKADSTHEAAKGRGSSSQTRDKARGGGGGGGGGGRRSHVVNAQNTRTMEVTVSGTSEEDQSHRRSSSKVSQLLDVPRRPSGRASSSTVTRLPLSVPEGRRPDKQTALTVSSVRSGTAKRCYHGNLHRRQHRHKRDQLTVVAKPTDKRPDFRRLRVTSAVSRDEAFRRTQRKERLGIPPANRLRPSSVRRKSPFSSTGGSDSEFSAECASLFHSTIMDTSEDETSNYTTNRFGDSESSEEERVKEGGSAGETGTGRNQLGAPGPRVKAFVKIKASHHLKKKIRRFRSGSLKLMTTV